MILCSNDLQMEGNASAPMSSEEEEWLAANIIDGSLPEGEAWHIAPDKTPRFNSNDSGAGSDSENC